MIVSYMPPPLGTMINYAGSGHSIPLGYALTLGQALRIADYPELFTAIGFTYGSTGPGTFLLPRYQDRSHNPFLIYTGS